MLAGVAAPKTKCFPQFPRRRFYFTDFVSHLLFRFCILVMLLLCCVCFGAAARHKRNTIALPNFLVLHRKIAEEYFEMRTVFSSLCIFIFHEKRRSSEFPLSFEYTFALSFMQRSCWCGRFKSTTDTQQPYLRMATRYSFSFILLRDCHVY